MYTLLYLKWITTRIYCIAQGTLLNVMWEPRWEGVWGRWHACLLAQSCLTLCDPLDCSSPGSFVYGILQARIVDWVPMPSSRDLPDPGIESASLCLLHCRRTLCPGSLQKSPQRRMDMCICTVESLCSAPETITLLTGYPPI